MASMWTRALLGAGLGLCISSAGCSNEAGGGNGNTGVGAQDVPGLAAGNSGGVAPLPAAGVGGAAGAAPLPVAGAAGAAGAPMAGAPMAGAAGAAPADPTAGMGAAGTAGVPMAGAPVAGDPLSPTPTDPVTPPAATPLGPEDGDPNTPVVSTPDVACGGPSGFFGSANFDIGGREMIVTYPCNKHAGAPMTFFLNLHGTTPVEQHFYQHGYFAVHQYTESHNLIVVTPSSVVEQWGNMDGGADEPHLMEIIDWVYSTFNGPDKFDIRGMWVGGHSWGAMYTTTFVCKPELADKIKGAIIMSGIGRNPACASGISVISSAAEMDIGPVVNQGTVPSSHGCGAAVMNTIGNNEETHWPDCDPGFVHANYFMLGKQHASSIDAVVVERIADLIKIARL